MQTGLVVYIESCLAPTVIQNIKDNALYRRINPDKFQIPITHRNRSRFFLLLLSMCVYTVCVRVARVSPVSGNAMALAGVDVTEAKGLHTMELLCMPDNQAVHSIQCSNFLASGMLLRSGGKMTYTAECWQCGSRFLPHAEQTTFCQRAPSRFIQL